MRKRTNTILWLNTLLTMNTVKIGNSKNLKILGDYFINNVFTYNQVSDLQMTPFYVILMTGNVN